MATRAWTETRIEPFGLDIEVDLSVPLPNGFAERLVAAFDAHKLLRFRNQTLDEARQVEILEHLGRVLGRHGEYREISSDGALGSGPLTWHSDLAFTEEPYKVISLHAVAVNDGESWTDFTNGRDVAVALPPALRDRVSDAEAVTLIASIQSDRHVSFHSSTDMPHQVRPVLIRHPRTGEEVLYVGYMQTSRIVGMDEAESDALLAALFDELYRPERIYRHRWNNGDFVIWDNIALQHSRGDLTGMSPRRLQRIVVADKSFFDLLPQFQVGDSRINAWGSGKKELVLD